MTREPDRGMTFNEALEVRLAAGRLEPAGVPPPRRRRRRVRGPDAAAHRLPPARTPRPPGPRRPRQRLPARSGQASTPPASAAPTAVPPPESELIVYNWSYYIGRETREQVPAEVRDQGQLRQVPRREHPDRRRSGATARAAATTSPTRPRRGSRASSRKASSRSSTTRSSRTSRTCCPNGATLPTTRAASTRCPYSLVDHRATPGIRTRSPRT